MKNSPEQGGQLETEIVPTTLEMLEELGFHPEDLQAPGEALEKMAEQGVVNAHVSEVSAQNGMLLVDSAKKQSLVGVIPDSVRKTLKAAGTALVMAASGTAAGMGHMMLEKPQPAYAASAEPVYLLHKQVGPDTAVEQYIEKDVSAFEITVNGFNFDAGAMPGFIRHSVVNKVYYSPEKEIRQGESPRKPIAFRVDKDNFVKRAEGGTTADLSITALDEIPVGERQYLGLTDRTLGGTIAFRGGTRPAGTSDLESTFQLGLRLREDKVGPGVALPGELNFRVLNNTTQEGAAGIAPSLGVGLITDTGKFLAELGVVIDSKNGELLKGRSGLLAFTGSKQFGGGLSLDAKLITTLGDEGKGSAEIIGRTALLDPKIGKGAVDIDLGLGASVHGATIKFPDLPSSQSEELRVPVVVRVVTKWGTLELNGYVNHRGQLGAGIGGSMSVPGIFPEIFRNKGDEKTKSEQK